MTAPLDQLNWLMRPLADLMEDPDTQDIAIQRENEVWQRARGRWLRHQIEIDLGALEAIGFLAASMRKQNLGPAFPLCLTEMPSGGRGMFCVPPAVPEGTIALTIREHDDAIVHHDDAAGRYRAASWNQWGRDAAVAGRDFSRLLDLFDDADPSDQEAALRFLVAAVRAKLNILIPGPTGSGKTTLLQTLLSAIDDSERIIIVQDAMELKLRQPNVVNLLFSSTSADVDPERKARVSISCERAMWALLAKRPDRVIVQELRDGDAAATYMKVATHHPGVITTLHGDGAAGGYRRIFNLAKPVCGFDADALQKQLAPTVDVIAPMREIGGSFVFLPMWFVAEAVRRGQTSAELLS